MLARYLLGQADRILEVQGIFLPESAEARVRKPPLGLDFPFIGVEILRKVKEMTGHVHSFFH